MPVMKRSLKLAGLAARLAGQEVAGRLRGLTETNTRIAQAKSLADALSELKGAAMKAGQLLSLDVGDLLPEEAREILSRLQGKAAPRPFAEMNRVLIENLGAEKTLELQNISETAFAAASIGQVHQAELQGQKVAVKIQYPDVRQAIDSDLRILRKIADSFLRLSNKSIDLTDTFLELRRVLEEETDFAKEAHKLLRYGQFLAKDGDYRVPKPFLDHCAPQVLTMEWMDGLPIKDWIRQQPDKERRQRMAHLVLDLFCREFSDWGFVQTDPNFANFLVNTEDQLICLDFGATLEYPLEFRKKYGDILVSFMAGQSDEVFQKAVEFGLLDPRENREVHLAFKDLIRVSLEPFSPDKQPFQFQDPDFEKRTREINIRFTRLLQYSPPPRQILFLHRKLGGIFNLVKSMGVALDLRPYWIKMTGS